MDNNDFGELKIDTTSFNGMTKLSKAMNNKSCLISYDDVTELTNAITTNNLINNAITKNIIVPNTNKCKCVTDKDVFPVKSLNFVNSR